MSVPKVFCHILTTGEFQAGCGCGWHGHIHTRQEDALTDAEGHSAATGHPLAGGGVEDEAGGGD